MYLCSADGLAEGGWSRSGSDGQHVYSDGLPSSNDGPVLKVTAGVQREQAEAHKASPGPWFRASMPSTLPHCVAKASPKPSPDSRGGKTNATS